VNEECYFDIINLSNYNVILGTPFMFQHKVSISLDPPTVVIGSKCSSPMKGERVTNLSSQPMLLYQDKLAEVRDQLLLYAQKICRKAVDTSLPPLREINHEIPLINTHKNYSWCPSKCPDHLREQWYVKRDGYLKSGRWEICPAMNAVPMLLLTKMGKEGGPRRLQTVVDLREQNTNTRKLSSPLPDIDSILRQMAMARAKYRLVIDLSDAYEQIRVKPKHIEHTAMVTPSGTMVSLVMQQGDCNTTTTFQMIMTQLFGPYIGEKLQNFLDDLFLRTVTLQEHVEIFKLVIDVLEKADFYISENKLQILQPEIKILGRLINDDGIKMDPHKVDSLAKWKTPTN
jgi:hypothetical protein